MESFKLTSWNIEHADKLLSALSSSSPDSRRKAEARRDAIREEIALLAPDILLVSEGPKGEQRARDFFALVAAEYDVVVRGSENWRDYDIRGAQWIWFLIRRNRPISARLLHIDQWRDAVEADSETSVDYDNGKWPVSYPSLVEDRLEFEIGQQHFHYRHPQVLIVEIDGHLLEIIGCHLKSKFTKVRPVGDASDKTFFDENRELVAEIVKARTKITTECADVRHYIDHRFKTDTSAPIIVCGDLNDGPGKERIERRFLYHDLIGTLQGEVFFAQRFLNHALFDAPQGERWSVFFRDVLDPGRNPMILLDHILFSQTFTNNPAVEHFEFQALRGGGLVEHEVHHAVNGTRPKYAETSDHKPVSMTFGRRAEEGDGGG
ncbi:endonuclease/exonuclease/phosphatase [Breoghania sp. L-A4]|nr:endonuclease/exonuclease/phosphatase [Breoghania sp. L-A4]